MFKMKKTMVIALLLTCMAIPTTLFAVSEGALIFLLIAPGSRASGMGEAFVAQADDAYAAYWNPGAMAFNRKTQIAGMHTNWLQGSGINDLYYEYLSWNQYFPEIGNVGAFIQFMSLGSQTQTDESGTALGDFTSYDVSIALAYGYQLNDNWGLGTNFKFIRSDLGPATGATDTKGVGMTFAFDFGVKAKDILYYANIDNPYIGELSWGLTLQNFGPDVTYVDDSQKDPLSVNLRTGLSYKAWSDELTDVTLNADINKLLANEDNLLMRLATDWNDNDYIYNTGIEYTYMKLLSLRGGYVNDSAGEIVGPSFGVGINYTFSKIYKLSADFAMQQGGDLTDYNKLFSLSLEF